MNIQAAAKSNRRIKRKHQANFMDPQPSGLMTFTATGRSLEYRPNFEDILADDWEVEEKTVTITESEFDEILKRNTPPSGFVQGSHIKREIFGEV